MIQFKLYLKLLSLMISFEISLRYKLLILLYYIYYKKQMRNKNKY